MSAIYCLCFVVNVVRPHQYLGPVQCSQCMKFIKTSKTLSYMFIFSNFLLFAVKPAKRIYTCPSFLHRSTEATSQKL